MFKNYSEARAFAQQKANASGSDFGLELNPIFKTYSVFGLPGVKSRRGFELRCEVVQPERGPYVPGHGPETHPPCGWQGA
jgi:hypothetical protein